MLLPRPSLPSRDTDAAARRARPAFACPRAIVCTRWTPPSAVALCSTWITRARSDGAESGERCGRVDHRRQRRVRRPRVQRRRARVHAFAEPDLLGRIHHALHDLRHPRASSRRSRSRRGRARGVSTWRPPRARVPSRATACARERARRPGAGPSAPDDAARRSASPAASATCRSRQSQPLEDDLVDLVARAAAR